MTKWALGIIIAIIAICVVEWIREICTFKVTHYHITSNKLKKLKKERKIIFLSDLHNNCYGKDNCKLIDAIKKESPDIILIGGDMLVGAVGRSAKVALEFVLALTDISPVYYANGNHEQRMKEEEEKYGTVYRVYKEALEKAGVLFLENKYVDEVWDECNVRIHGLEIPSRCYTKFQPTFLQQDEIIERIGQADENRYHILMAHNPQYMEDYKIWNADLILSGHYHGGMVRIPGLGGIITPHFEIFPKYSGEYSKEGEQSIVVSRGMGSHSIRLRFLNPAEVIVLHVGSEE